MARRLRKDVAWTEFALKVDDLTCSLCARRMHVKKTRRR